VKAAGATLGLGGRTLGSRLAPEERARREQVAQERVACWKAIDEAGGIEKWIALELRTKGLSTEGLEPPTEREKAQYKAKKKAEAEERRKLRRRAWEAYHATHITHLGAGVHWEDDPDVDSFDVDQREARARDNGLPELKGAAELAQAMGLPVARLRWLTYHRETDTASHYYTFTIAKRDGSPRTIFAPKRELKAAQRWMLRKVAERLPVHNAAHGFVPDRSIVTNAAVHAGADVIVKLDIRDFFPTVTWRRVKGLLRKGGLSESVATLLSLLSTESPRELVQFRGKTLHVAVGPRALPQGAPTSPALTNALCMRLDRRLSGLARTLGFTYTRYADDLAFSWRPATPPAAGGEVGRAPVGALLRGVGQILPSEGFRIHPDKTRVLRRGDRQKITGLVVNQPPTGGSAPAARVPREVLRQLRAAVHNLEAGKPGKPGETLQHLSGMAAFVHMTDPARGRVFLDRLAALAARQPPAVSEP
jgi:hypothetical protein